MRLISLPVNKTAPLKRLNRFTCLLGRFLHFNVLNYSNKADKTHTRRTQTKMAASSLMFAGLCLSQGACAGAFFHPLVSGYLPYATLTLRPKGVRVREV